MQKPLPALSLIGNDLPSGSYGICEGDCDRDSDCKRDLVCFQRDASEAVPGCAGSARTGRDYCVEPQPSKSSTASQGVTTKEQTVTASAVAASSAGSATATPTQAPFLPLPYGEALYNTNWNLGLQVSRGLSVRVVATTGRRVRYRDGSMSSRSFHGMMDGAGIVGLPGGGYVYVSNSEEEDGDGGKFVCAVLRPTSLSRGILCCSFSLPLPFRFRLSLV